MILYLIFTCLTGRGFDLAYLHSPSSCHDNYYDEVTRILEELPTARVFLSLFLCIFLSTTLQNLRRSL